MKSLIVVAALSILYIALLAGLLYTIKTDRRKLSFVVKTSLSLVFTIMALYLGGMWWGTAALIWGLMMSVGGDVALGAFYVSNGKEWSYFYLGMGEFVIAQIMYFYISCLYRDFYWQSLLMSLIITIGFFIMNRSIILKSRPAQASMAYSFAITALLFNSIFAIVLGAGNMFMVLFLIGILLFWVSDYVLFGIVFRREKYTLMQNYINKTTYFIGQLIIVMSLFFFKEALMM